VRGIAAGIAMFLGLRIDGCTMGEGGFIYHIRGILVDGKTAAPVHGVRVCAFGAPGPYYGTQEGLEPKSVVTDDKGAFEAGYQTLWRLDSCISSASFPCGRSRPRRRSARSFYC
jgi:hypothetical protein